MTSNREPPRLCLVFELKLDSDTPARLERALAGASPASLILSASPGLRLEAAAAKPLVAMAQKKGVATLIENDAELARALGADGVHIRESEDPEAAYEAARKLLGAGLIVGADAGGSRHDAMTIGEMGADYIGFGIAPGAAGAEAAALRRDLVAWWAEIFEVPVMALDVETAEEAQDLADSGADFIAVRVPSEIAMADLERWAAAFAAAVAGPQAVN